MAVTVAAGVNEDKPRDYTIYFGFVARCLNPERGESYE
jgi:hypothetical protein